MFDDRDEWLEGLTYFRNHGYHTEFVWRRNLREELKTTLKGKVRLLQILGGPVVGKSRLAEQISNELIEEAIDTDTKLKCVRILLEAHFIRAVHLKILGEFAKDIILPRTGFQDKIRRILKSQPDTYFLVLLDDCDQILSNKLSTTTFRELVYSLVHFPKLKVILTSRVQFSLPRIDDIFQKTILLKGMSDLLARVDADRQERKNMILLKEMRDQLARVDADRQERENMTTFHSCFENLMYRDGRACLMEYMYVCTEPIEIINMYETTTAIMPPFSTEPIEITNMYETTTAIMPLFKEKGGKNRVSRGPPRVPERRAPIGPG